MMSAITRGVRLVLSVSFAAVFSFCFFQTASAAYIYLDPAEAEVFRGDSFTLAVRIDTDEDECVNVADVVIDYDPAIRAVDISRGNSILSLWVEEPVINEEEHTISFAGGIPGGYCGRIPGDPTLTNILLELVFRLPGFSVGSADVANASVRVNEVSQVFLHDQFGTKAALTTSGAELTLSAGAGTQVADEWNERVNADTEPPADFRVTLTRDDTAFSGKYFITFSTLDKQSGLDHYEVMEEPFEDFDLFTWGRADAPWVIAQSPYVLEDQTLNSTIRVRAIDKAGNVTVVTLVPDETMRTTSIGTLLTVGFILVVLCGLLALGLYLLWRRKQRIISSYTAEHEL